jgi:hypothetical protein
LLQYQQMRYHCPGTCCTPLCLQKKNPSRFAKLICTPEETINRTKLGTKKSKKKFSTSSDICEHAGEMQILSLIESSCRLLDTDYINIGLLQFIFRIFR